VASVFRCFPHRTLVECSREGEGAIVFDHACKLGLEGIVSKRPGGAYASGRYRNWLKVKNPAFERR
jgi:ATP-dependent DNA ligase